MSILKWVLGLGALGAAGYLLVHEGGSPKFDLSGPLSSGAPPVSPFIIGDIVQVPLGKVSIQGGPPLQGLTTLKDIQITQLADASGQMRGITQSSPVERKPAIALFQASDILGMSPSKTLVI